MINRASAKAYAPSCVIDAMARVASATEGAAPNTPAKDFGRTRSPKTANAETRSRPGRNGWPTRLTCRSSLEKQEMCHHTQLERVVGAVRFCRVPSLSDL